VEREVAVVMPLRDWLVIDAVLDNVHALTATDLSEMYDPKAAEIAISVRERGWEVERPLLDGGGWPPDEPTMALPITVRLTEGEWLFVTEVLEADPSTPASLVSVIVAAVEAT
jgi:hypothetical protein